MLKMSMTEYLGCELIRDRSAKTATTVHKGYAERVLKTFGMWDCKPCATPLDANSVRGLEPPMTGKYA